MEHKKYTTEPNLYPRKLHNRIWKPLLIMLHIRKLFIGFIFLAALASCTDKWDEHIRLRDGVVRDNLMEILSNDPDLKVFAGLLSEAGWEDELSSSKLYTVWAPTDDAMSTLSGVSLDDSATLARFIGNHICFTSYSYNQLSPQKKMKMFSGKNLVLDSENKTIDEAFVQEPYDILAANGILHKIDRPLVPKPNVWEIIESTSQCPLHTGYLTGMSRMVFDPSVAKIIGVDPITGRPIYDMASGMVWYNPFIDRVRDLRFEDSLTTVFLIEDPVFNSEFQKYRNYFVLDDPEESDSLTAWHICRDLVFPGYREPGDLPDTLLSMFNIKIPFSTSSLVQTMEASNGIVYVLNNCDVRLQDKIPPIIIEGEDSTRIITTSLTGQTGYKRQKPEASGGYDFILDNHGANPGSIKYYLGNVVATTYKFYWKAVNDFNGSYRNPNPDLVLQQELARVRIIGMAGKNYIWSQPSIITPAPVPITDTLYQTAQEIYLGQLVLVQYQDLWLQVTGGGNNMTITLDYLKAVPVFE